MPGKPDKPPIADEDKLQLPKALPRAFGGDSDAFVTKINATGSGLLYSTYLGGTLYDYGTSIAVDADGNAYVAGGTASQTAS